jgi:predicted component of type VI protein secretion system
MLGELIPCGGGDPIPLLKPAVVIGRRDRCDITLAFPNISSQHCELVYKNGYWEIRDLNSRNGIKVNDERCDCKWLMPGDVVSIAKHRYRIQYQPDPSAPPPVEEDAFAVSLMEKAGLAKREERPRPKPKPASDDGDQREDKNPPGPALPSDEDDDLAMKWLNESD